MKKYKLLFLLALFLFCMPFTALSIEPLRIDVLYLNHGPMRPTLRDLRSIFPGYGNSIAVFWHDFESEDGERFKTKMGQKGHVPLVIWIDGKKEWPVNGNVITFKGFPTGSGPLFFQGKWEIEDLTQVLDHLTGRN